MLELIISLIDHFGFLGVAASVIFLIVQSKPVTLITSSDLELRFLSKEKRFLHTSIYYIFKVLAITVILTAGTRIVIQNKIIFRNSIAIASMTVTVAVFFCVLYKSLKGERLYHIIKKRNSTHIKVLIIFLYVMYIFLWILLPAYYLGTQAYAEFFNEDLTQMQKLAYTIGLGIINFFIVITIIYPGFTILFEYLDVSEKSKRIYIGINDTDWFLFHPFSDDKYLLGDKPNINECTRFTVLAKDELMKYEFKVNQLMENYAERSSVE